jgi:hypothetical protein
LKRIAIAALLTLTLACASSDKTPAPPTPAWEAVPAMIVDTLCAQLRAERLTSGEVAIFKTTQPLIRAASLRGLADRGGQRANPGLLAGQFAAYNVPMRIIVPSSGCAWRAIEASDAGRYRDVMAVEISSPLPNPFAKKQSGLFARVSLAGAHATWYWVPLRWNGADWELGPVMSLAVWE